MQKIPYMEAAGFEPASGGRPGWGSTGVASASNLRTGDPRWQGYPVPSPPVQSSRGPAGRSPPEEPRYLGAPRERRGRSTPGDGLLLIRQPERCKSRRVFVWVFTGTHTLARSPSRAPDPRRDQHAPTFKEHVEMAGLEPATSAVRRRRSPTELHPHAFNIIDFQQ